MAKRIILSGTVKYQGKYYHSGEAVEMVDAIADELVNRKLGMEVPLPSNQSKDDPGISNVGGLEPSQGDAGIVVTTPMEELCQVSGVTKNLAILFIQNGITGILDLQQKHKDDLVKLGVKPSVATKIIQDSRTFKVEG